MISLAVGFLVRKTFLTASLLSGVLRVDALMYDADDDDDDETRLESGFEAFLHCLLECGSHSRAYVSFAILAAWVWVTFACLSVGRRPEFQWLLATAWKPRETKTFIACRVTEMRVDLGLELVRCFLLSARAARGIARTLVPSKAKALESDAQKQMPPKQMPIMTTTTTNQASKGPTQQVLAAPA